MKIGYKKLWLAFGTLGLGVSPLLGCTHLISSVVLTDPTLNRTSRQLAAQEGFRASMLTVSDHKVFEVNILKTPLMLLSDVTEQRVIEPNDCSNEETAAKEGTCAREVAPDFVCGATDLKVVPQSLGLKWRLFVVPAVGLYVVELAQLAPNASVTQTNANLESSKAAANYSKRLSLAFADMASLETALPYFSGVAWEELASMLETKTPTTCTDLQFAEHDGYNFPVKCTNVAKDYVFTVNKFVSFNDGFYFPKIFTWNAGFESVRPKANSQQANQANTGDLTQNKTKASVKATTKTHPNISEVSTKEYCFSVRGAAPIKGNVATNDIFRRALTEIETGIAQGRIRRVSAQEGIIKIAEFLE